MTDPASNLSPLGEILEAARKTDGLSKREAARRAGISEARWRQIVTGWQNPHDRTVPANPRSITVIAAARAVGIDPNVALRAAGLPPVADDPPPTSDPDSDALRRVLLADLTVEQQETIIKRIVREQREEQRRLSVLVDQLIAEAQDRP